MNVKNLGLMPALAAGLLVIFGAPSYADGDGAGPSSSGSAHHFARPVPTPMACNYAGSISINGTPAAAGDEIAVFDPDAVLCGVFRVKDPVKVPGSYGIVQIYGDDPGTPGVDEGAEPGDELSFKVWDASSATVYEGESLSLQAGSPLGAFFVPSQLPPVWRDRAGCVLNIGVTSADALIAFELHLEPGWNLISTPLLLDDSSVAGVFRRPGGQGVYHQGAVWRRIAGALTPTATLEPGYGYWVFVLEPVSVTLHGRLPDDADLPLTAGWSLVGIKQTTPMGRTLASWAEVAAWGWDAVNQCYFVVRLRDDSRDARHAFVPGQGYWLHLGEQPR